MQGQLAAAPGGKFIQPAGKGGVVVLAPEGVAVHRAAQLAQGVMHRFGGVPIGLAGLLFELTDGFAAVAELCQQGMEITAFQRFAAEHQGGIFPL